MRNLFRILYYCLRSSCTTPRKSMIYWTATIFSSVYEFQIITTWSLENYKPGVREAYYNVLSCSKKYFWYSTNSLRLMVCREWLPAGPLSILLMEGIRDKIFIVLFCSIRHPASSFCTKLIKPRLHWIQFTNASKYTLCDVWNLRGKVIWILHWIFEWHNWIWKEWKCDFLYIFTQFH